VGVQHAVNVEGAYRVGSVEGAYCGGSVVKAYCVAWAYYEEVVGIAYGEYCRGSRLVDNGFVRHIETEDCKSLFPASGVLIVGFPHLDISLHHHPDLKQL